MFNRKLIAMAIAFVLATPPGVLAQDADLGKIREEIKQIRDAYEKRIQALEKRLSEAEAKAGKTGQKADSAQTAAIDTGKRPTSESAFNPAVSMILQGTMSRTSQDPNQHQITGFVPSGGEVGPPRRGFGLAETELAITANIDHYFRGLAVLAVAPEGGLEAEEAWFQTLSLPYGLGLKGGRFFSGIGYQNEQHQHAWDFQDAPLVYKAFLGNKLKQDGLQLKWIAPTDLLIELGAELSAGDGFPGSDRNKNGIGGSAIFMNVGGDIGASTAWRLGISHLRTSPTARTHTDTDSLGGEVTNRFTGNAKVLGLNGVLKWAPNGNAQHNSFTLQGEYFRLKQDGALTYDDTAQATPQFAATFTDYLRTDQSGWYAQGVWKFNPGWRIGYRYDALRYGTVSNGIVNNGLGLGLSPTSADFPVLANYSPTRNTLMLDWSPSEFSRLRLQFASDKSRLGATDNQLFMQYIHSLGAHGGHKF